VILNTNAIVTLFTAGQFSTRFDFAQGVPSNPLRVFGSIVVINAIQNPDENCHSYTESPIRLKIGAVSAEVKRTRLGVSFFVEIRPNYFSIATVTFRIALIQQIYHGVFSFTDKICCSNLPSKAIANAIDGIKPDLKRMIKNEIF
jgi:hypothetical protein